nr:mucin-5AC-like [Rhipicephalus microplus]
MQHIVGTVVMICIVVVNGGRRCGNAQVCGPTQCGPLERPVHGSPRRDRFCRPLFTPPWELWKLRSCVCKRRYLRNSWGECIPRLKCIPCKFKWQRDYRTCAPGCPATCHETFRTSCNVPCTDGCVCPPGWVVHPKYPRKCVKAHKCLPRCPPHSSYQACVSTCLPKCGQTPPTKCHVICDRGACICKKGYLEYEQNGEKTCVLQALCPWNNRTTHLFSPNATEHTGTIEGSATSGAFISDTESVPGQPEHAGHGFTISRVPTNVTSTHLLGTSSENSGHGAVTSSGGSESLLSGGGRIGSAGLDTRLENPISTGRHVLIGTSRNTEVAVASGSSGFEEATAGAHSNSAPRSSPERVVESVTASVIAGRLPNSRPTVTLASSGVGKATIGVPSGGLLNSGTTGIPPIPTTDTESARENTHLIIPGNTGSAAPGGFSEVAEAASTSSNTIHQDLASTASSFVELAGRNIFRSNLRNGMVPGTAGPSRVAEATLRATSTGTVPPSFRSMTGLTFQPEEAEVRDPPDS